MAVIALVCHHLVDSRGLVVCSHLESVPVTPEELVEQVVVQYLTSGDFNGLPAYALTNAGTLSSGELKQLLLPLVRAGVLTLNFGDQHLNPHIRAFPEPPALEQAAKLESTTQNSYAIYPSVVTLQARVEGADYQGRPFSLMLALGAGQLEFKTFDLAVLDHYRRDPRYLLWTDDIHVTLSIHDEAYESTTFPEKHKVLMQHFGFCYSEDDRRAVSVFLRDLDGLTPEHQQLWATYSIDGEYSLHPDYYKSAILGDWGQGISLRDAFIEELKGINAMCAAIGWPPLFRIAGEEPPPELAFLLRPTTSAFNEFVLALDKLMSENLNSTFFPDTIARHTERERPDSKIEVQQRGSLALLKDWLTTHIRTPDPKPLQEAVATFRRVRKLRQKPAHALDGNNYDEALFEEQRLLFVDAYNAVRTLRLILQNHPKARPLVNEMDERVVKGEIWPM